jgi:hypothetical protein
MNLGHPRAAAAAWCTRALFSNNTAIGYCFSADDDGRTSHVFDDGAKQPQISSYRNGAIANSGSLDGRKGEASGVRVTRGFDPPTLMLFFSDQSPDDR